MRADAVMSATLFRLLLIAPLAAVVPLVFALADDAQIPPDPRLSAALAAVLGGLALSVVMRTDDRGRTSSELPPSPAALASLLLWTLAIALANSTLPANLGWYGMTLVVPTVVAAFIGRPGFAAMVVTTAILGFATSAATAHQHASGAAGAVLGFATFAIAASTTTSLLARALSRDHDERTCLAHVAVATAQATTIEAGLAEVADVLARSPLAGCRPIEVDVSRVIGTRYARLGLATLTWHDDRREHDARREHGDRTRPVVGADEHDGDGVTIDDDAVRVVVGDGAPARYAIEVRLAQPLGRGEVARCREHLAGVALQVRALVDRVRAIDELEQIGQTDELTGLPTRRAVLSRLELERIETAVDGRLSLALVALDDLDAYAERFGPPEGNRLLTDLGTMLATRVRGTDLVARYDVATFCLVLPATTTGGAVHLVDELHTWAALLRPGQPTTFSAGVTDWDGDEPMRALLGRVERALAQAQTDGKDRTVVVPASTGDDVSDPTPTR
jgi:diguanylate cyclase (GGDEF)-like protein